MAATGEDTKTKRRQPKRTNKAQEQAADVAKAKAKDKTDDNSVAEQAAKENDEAIEALDPKVDPKRRRIGKPPEEGGKEGEYAYYMQDKLHWMARQRFFSLTSGVMSRAIRATGGSVGGMADVFGNQGGTIAQRFTRLKSRDWSDASSFAVLAFELISYSPDYLIECYTIWLDVPRDDRDWAKQLFEEPWDPKNERWGLKDEDHRDIIETFIDQNAEDIKDFFTEELPKIWKRAAERVRAEMEEDEGQESS